MKTSINLTLLFILLAGIALPSGLLVPVAYPDGLSIDPTVPQWGASIYAIPGSTWWVGFNDNVGDDCSGLYGDCDANDAMAHVVFSPLLTGPLSGSVFGTLYYDISTSDLDNDIRWVTLFPWLEPGQNQPILTAAGSVVPVYDRVGEHGSTIFVTGLGPGNPGGLIHAWVGTPEPATMTLIGMGLAALALIRKRRKA